ncbi:hypothetical protein LTR74_007718 [Friedmanniomyces endolithicus]|nr:hypothetical protein LTR74_007718 [Friedmanniomyces endolithicus]
MSTKPHMLPDDDSIKNSFFLFSSQQKTLDQRILSTTRPETKSKTLDKNQDQKPDIHDSLRTNYKPAATSMPPPPVPSAVVSTLRPGAPVFTPSEPETVCCREHMATRRPDIRAVLMVRNPHLEPIGLDLLSPLGTPPRPAETGSFRQVPIEPTPVEPTPVEPTLVEPTLVEPTPVSHSDLTPPKIAVDDQKPVGLPPFYVTVYMHSSPLAITPVGEKPVESPPVHGQTYVLSSPFTLRPVGPKLVKSTPVSSAQHNGSAPFELTPVGQELVDSPPVSSAQSSDAGPHNIITAGSKPVESPPTCCSTHKYAKPLNITRILKFNNKDLKAKDCAHTVGRGTLSGFGERGSVSSDLHSGTPTSKGTDSAADQRVVQIRVLEPRQRLEALRQVLVDEVDIQRKLQQKKIKPVVQPGTCKPPKPLFAYVPNPLESRHLALEMKNDWYFGLLTREIMNGIHDCTQCRNCRKTFARVGIKNALASIKQDVKQSGLSKGRGAIQPVAEYTRKMIPYGTGERLSKIILEVKGARLNARLRLQAQNKKRVAIRKV